MSDDYPSPASADYGVPAAIALNGDALVAKIIAALGNNTPPTLGTQGPGLETPPKPRNALAAAIAAKVPPPPPLPRRDPMAGASSVKAALIQALRKGSTK